MTLPQLCNMRQLFTRFDHRACKTVLHLLFEAIYLSWKFSLGRVKSTKICGHAGGNLSKVGDT